jgi:hypothetical protein
MASNTPERARGALATFVPRSGLPSNESLEVRLPLVRIGQGPQNEISLDDDTVSTRHAQLEFAAGAWKLTDLGSRNGTWVEGSRLEANVPTSVADGASVRIGAVKLQFVAHPEADVESARASYKAPEAPKPLAERSKPRLPVWLLVLIILIVVIIAFVVLNLGGQPQPVSTGLSVTLVEQSEWLISLAA